MTTPITIENIEDIAALAAYLKASDYVRDDETPTIRVLPGGVSNRTVWVGLPDGSTWVLKQALSKLRVKVDWFSSVERIHREAAGLRWLSHSMPSGLTPAFVFEDHDNHILATTAVADPHENWKQRLLKGEVDTDYMRQFGEILACIHRSADSDPGGARAEFQDQSFFESLRLEPYYAYAGEQVPPAAAFLHQLIAETRQRHIAIVHGDYSPKNILIYAGKLIILDYEVIHFGDPAFDVGFSMTHLLSKALFMPEQRQALYEGALLYWQTYLQTLNKPEWLATLDPASVRHTLACLLARAAGRSPLEYLSPEQRQQQQQIVLDLIRQLPTTIPQLIRDYHDRLA